MTKIKTTENSKYGKDAEQWDSHRQLLGMQNGTTGLETHEHCPDDRHYLCKPSTAIPLLETHPRQI